MANEPRGYPRREFLAQVAAVPALAAVVAQWCPGTAVAQAAVADPLTITALPEAELAREVESLMRFVDPQIAYRHVPIPPERNAWPYFEKAIKAYVEEPHDEEYIEADIDFADSNVPPNNKMLARMLAWAKENKAALDLLDRGIAVGELELPRARESIRLSFSVDPISDLRSLARAKGLSSRLAALDGNTPLAMKEATGILQLSRIMLASECLLVDYLVASSIYEIGEHAMYFAVMNSNATTNQARHAVHEILNCGPSSKFLHRALRVELCRSLLPCLANYPATNDPQALASRYVLSAWESTPDLTDEGRQNTLNRISDAARLFEGHPRLFDHEATVTLASRRIREYIERSAKPFVQRYATPHPTLRDELAAFPKNIQVFGEITFYGLDENLPSERLDDAELEAARSALRNVDNLLGKLLVYEHQLRFGDVPPELANARMTATGVRIALAHYEREHGELPDSLGRLVDDNWFKYLPLDPFDRQPFRYSHELRRIWSVGPAGTNDPKQHKPYGDDNAWLEEHDLCWQTRSVPQSNNNVSSAQFSDCLPRLRRARFTRRRR